MSVLHLDHARSAIILVDLQQKFLDAIHESARVVDRSRFLVRVANLLKVPVLATEQYPEKMGNTDPAFEGLVSTTISKLSFSAMESSSFVKSLQEIGRDQIIVIGIETHICVSLTAHDLLKRDYEVVVCPDATSSRTQDRHKLGMERIRDAGIVPAHTEAIAYEWMKTADQPIFREFLTLVKDSKY